MIDFISEAERIKPWMISVRRDIHAHPETGNHEYRTKDKITEILKELNIEVYPVLETGVIGVLHGREAGNCAAFRSDMDALPILEKTGLPFSSENDGVMHACGHDMHMASLLGCARILSEHCESLKGTYVFIFQPDEEGEGGAERILKTGILDKLGVQTVYGMHVEPSLPTGVIGYKYGSFYANAVKFDVHVTGKGCHGAEPEKGTDSLYAAAEITCALKQLTREENKERSVCTVGMFQAGTARNIISDHADFSGILRCSSLALREIRKKQIADILHDKAVQNGVYVQSRIVDGYIGVENHDEDVALVKNTALQLFGPSSVKEETKATMTTEDFGFYLKKYKGCFYHLGINSPYPLHSDHMNPDENALVHGAAFSAALLASYGDTGYEYNS